MSKLVGVCSVEDLDSWEFAWVDRDSWYSEKTKKGIRSHLYTCCRRPLRQKKS